MSQEKKNSLSTSTAAKNNNLEKPLSVAESALQSLTFADEKAVPVSAQTIPKTRTTQQSIQKSKPNTFENITSVTQSSSNVRANQQEVSMTEKKVPNTAPKQENGSVSAQAPARPSTQNETPTKAPMQASQSPSSLLGQEKPMAKQPATMPEAGVSAQAKAEAASRPVGAPSKPVAPNMEKSMAAPVKPNASTPAQESSAKVSSAPVSPAQSTSGQNSSGQNPSAQQSTQSTAVQTPTAPKAAAQASAQEATPPNAPVTPSAMAQEQPSAVTPPEAQSAAPEAPTQQNFEPEAMPVAPAEVDYVPPLLRSLSSLLRLRGKSVSPQFLYAGLAGIGEVTPGECIRAAARSGLQAKIMQRPTLDDISPLTLPCVLILENGRSCVLTALTQHLATIILPELGDEPQQVNRDRIANEYTGYAVFGSVDNHGDKRIESFRRTPGKRWFWDAIKHYGPIYRHAAFASVIINLIALGSPLFVMNVYDRVVPNNAIDTLWVLAIGISLAYLFDFLLRTLRNHFVDTAGRNADVVISSMLVDKVLSMQLDHKPESTGALVNNVREFESLREFFSSSTLLSCIDLPFLFLFIIFLGFIGGPLIILPLVAMPIMFGAGILLQSLAKRAAEKSYSQNMHKNALLTEIVNGLETLKCCQGETRMQHMWETVVEESAQANIETKKYGSLAVGFSVFITQFVTVAMVVWGVHLIAAGELTMGGLIGSNILAGRAMAPLMQMAGLITRYQNSRISLDALNTLMSLPSEDRDASTTVDFGPLDPAFTLESVSFAYPNAARTAVEDLSLHIAPGEKVGVIGRMGSGKSTLIRLLIGLYQPTEGAVKFGGIDIRQMAGTDLRTRVGFAPQDTVLFYGSVRDNIVLGDPFVSDQRMLRAASISSVTDFIRTKPEGFGTQVGEQGKALSGGQRQAIGLARALVRDPEVLILDEPTSNMDTSSELTVQTRLMKHMRNKTLILVTHRMSMLKLVDRLIVMDGGRIVADGPKDLVIEKLRSSSMTKAQEQKQQELAV